MSTNLKTNAQTYLNLVFKDMDTDEFITVHTINGGSHKDCHFQNTTDVIKLVQSQKIHNNIFYNIALTDGLGRSTKNMKSVCAIVLDFDFKDKDKPNIKDFTDNLKSKLGLYISAIIDSGHGFHVMIEIEKTTNLKNYSKVVAQLQKIYDSDPMAIGKTQLMRMPYSFNLKEEGKKISVNVVFVKPATNPYTLSQIQTIINKRNTSVATAKYTDMKPCIKKMIDLGLEKGYRNFGLLRIVKNLQLDEKSKEDILKIAQEYGNRCTPPIPPKTLISDFERIYNNDYNVYGCHISKNPKQDRILQNLCDDTCPYKHKKAPVMNKNGKNIPQSIICNKWDLNPAQLSMLIHIYFNEKIKKNPNQFAICTNTFYKIIKKLKDCKLIVNNNGYYKCKQELLDEEKTEYINQFFAYGVLQKNIKPANANIYYGTAKYIAENKKLPTYNELAISLNVTPQHVTNNVNKLDFAQMIAKETALKRQSSSDYYYLIKII